MKTYRERKLHRRVQLAKPGPDGKPLRDEAGQIQLDAGGQWFLVVATGADRVRLLPVDHAAFFTSKAEEATRLLRAKGKTGVVTAERLYSYYTSKFTKPSETYAPADHPEEFTVVLSKHLAVNLAHGYGGTSRSGPTEVLADDLSVLAGLMSTEDVTPTSADSPGVTAPEETPSKKRKGKTAPAPEATVELGPLTMSDLMN